MNTKNLEQFALYISVFGTIFMSILGISFGLWLKSEAILLDGFFNFISFIMAVASLWVSKRIALGPNKNFQFDFLNFIPLVNVIKGLLILIISLFALISAIIAILNGGRSMNAELAVIYALIAAGGCLIIAFIENNIAQKTGSSMVIVDSKNWIVNGLISFSVGIAFLIVVFIQNTPFEWFVPYSDSTIVIGVVLVSIGIPIQVVIENLKQLLLAAPASKIQRELKQILYEVIQDLPCAQLSIKMTQTGQYIYVYLLWLLPQEAESKNIRQIDKYRNTVRETLGQYHQNISIDILFTEDKAWFESKK